ncbi:hypothetical protein Vadar_028761 [Vaccinium darrowii]|uniref:Uncharacterized protein n=1 Tax=Vaccinium darrowii TaxID=229202 RepID=A0ACB7XUU9_9ERIC|nr:hypothetical protein Vadar_028761 [Vaccinium darrowii]
MKFNVQVKSNCNRAETKRTITLTPDIASTTLGLPHISGELYTWGQDEGDGGLSFGPDVDQVSTKESCLVAQREDLRGVMEFAIPKEFYARTLLIHYRRDVEKLFAVLVEKGRPFLSGEAGVTVVE